MEADRMAAPQGPCPLPGGARFAGIESRDDAPPRSMAMRHGGGARNASAAFSAQNASGSEYRQNRSSVIGRSRKQCLAERNRGRHSRTRCSDASRGRMMPFARVEHGLPLRQRMLPPFPGAYPARPPLTAFSKRKCSHDRLPDGGGGTSLHTPLTRRASGGRG